MSWASRKFFRCAMIVFSWFVVPYSRVLNIRTTRKKLPPMKSDLLEIPAIKLAAMIRTRQVSYF